MELLRGRRQEAGAAPHGPGRGCLRGNRLLLRNLREFFSSLPGGQKRQAPSVLEGGQPFLRHLPLHQVVSRASEPGRCREPPLALQGRQLPRAAQRDQPPGLLPVPQVRPRLWEVTELHARVFGFIGGWGEEQRDVPPAGGELGFQANGWDLWDLWVGPPGRVTSLSREVCKKMAWTPYRRPRTWERWRSRCQCSLDSHSPKVKVYSRVSVPGLESAWLPRHLSLRPWFCALLCLSL